MSCCRQSPRRVSPRQLTSAHVSPRQRASAHASPRQHGASPLSTASTHGVSTHQPTPARRQPMSARVSTASARRQHGASTPATLIVRVTLAALTRSRRTPPSCPSCEPCAHAPAHPPLLFVVRTMCSRATAVTPRHATARHALLWCNRRALPLLRHATARHASLWCNPRHCNRLGYQARPAVNVYAAKAGQEKCI